jgi:hypothetical protein
VTVWGVGYRFEPVSRPTPIDPTNLGGDHA